MRLLLPAAIVLAMATVAIAAPPPRLDPSRPEDVIQLQRKIWCSLDDGQPAYLWSQGSVYSHVPGERDRRLFNFQIWNARACQGHSDPKRGPGYRSVSREIMIYLDPATNELLRTWRNPWTGETVEVVHTQNDPVNMAAPQYAYDADGRPARLDVALVGGRAITTSDTPLFYDNPLGGDYQAYVGGQYHAMEMLNVYTYASELLDPRVRTLPHWSRSWKRTSGFLPWMRMGDRPGMLIFTAVGQRVSSIAQLPMPIRGALQAEFAKYQSPPPLDDSRPNETSWTYFKRVLKPAGSSPAVPAGTAAPSATAATQPARPAETPTAPTAQDATLGFATDMAIDCAIVPEQPLISWWRGRIYGRRAGEKDRTLFNLQRTRVSRCEQLTDPVRGRGYRVLARDLTVYLDAATGTVLRKWRNPWSGAEVTVLHSALDPVVSEVRWERDASGAPVPGRSRFVLTDRVLTGADATATWERNPLGGDFQDAVGGQLQLLDYTTSEMPLDTPRTRRQPVRDAVLSWGQVSPWLPWMGMGSAEGVLVVHAAGMQLASLDDVPAVMHEEITAHYPEFAAPPPVGESRPSATPWSLYAASAKR